MNTNRKKRWLLIIDPLYGNSGKGKVFAVIANLLKPFACIECGSGPTAAHTVGYNGKRYTTRHIPPGYFVEDTILGISKGVAVFEYFLNKELKELSQWSILDKLALDPLCPIVKHDSFSQYNFDEIIKTENKHRAQKRIGKKCSELKEYKPFIDRWSIFASRKQDNVVMVMAQHGVNLSQDVSSGVSVPPICNLLDVAKQLNVEESFFDDVILVVKAMPTTTLNQSLPFEIPWPNEISHERGLVSGRIARIALGHDMELLKYMSEELNATAIVITFVDYLSKLKGARSVSRLIELMQDKLNLPVWFVSTGPNLDDVRWNIELSSVISYAF